MQRHHGYVTGFHETSPGHRVWTVRVKDQSSQYDNSKLIVASVRRRMELARGLNVHFAIGTVDDQSGKKVLRAVDVCLETADDQVKP